MNEQEQALFDTLVAQLNEQQETEIQIRIDTERRRFLISGLKAAVDNSPVSVTAEEFSRMLTALDERLFPQE
jgi:FKBP-type peptidyl-prolyl cis-trans isomerase (trigger factor)